MKLIMNPCVMILFCCIDASYPNHLEYEQTTNNAESVNKELNCNNEWLPGKYFLGLS